MKTKMLTLFLTLFILLGLTGCGSGKDLPMEVTLDGYTVVLGETTIQDIVDLGYEPHLERLPDVASDGDKYISFYYSLDRGAGDQFWIWVCVPWSGNSDISSETTLSLTEGIIKSVTFSKGSTEKISASYNGMDIQELSFEYAIDEWGAKENDKTTIKAYKADLKKGYLSMEAESTLDEELYELTVSLSQKQFDSMQ